MISKKWGEEQISLPFHVKITQKEIKTISQEIKKFFKKFYISKKIQGCSL